MAELSTFLPSSGSQYVTDLFSGNSVSATTTSVSSDNASIVNLSGKGVIHISITSSTATVSLDIDGVSFSGDRETLARMVGQGGQDTFNTGRVSVNLAFKSSVTVGASGLSSGAVSVTVSV